MWQPGGRHASSSIATQMQAQLRGARAGLPSEVQEVLLPGVCQQLRLLDLRRGMGGPLSALLEGRGQADAEEESRRGISSPFHASAHPKVSLQCRKIRDDQGQIPPQRQAKRSPAVDPPKPKPKTADPSIAS